ncbi:hypothetical protein ABZ619_38020 [Streptomyces sp. NPDC007851]|uniref:hypothetical protein n=1 Tax=Streptomyces sp. NPDC007851 TaxID=3155008 RepID=UPI0033D612A2
MPSSNDGSVLGSGDYAKATVTYLDDTGLGVDTAIPGGRIATTEHDAMGNTVRELSPANRELALGASTSTDPLLAGALADTAGSADAAELLSTVTEYTTADDGSEQMAGVYGPLHTITLQHALSGGTAAADLAAGTETLARTHTTYTYDENRPSDAVVSDEQTSTTTGATVAGYPADADRRTTATTYDWTAGLPLSTVTDPSGLAVTTGYGYDSDGNLTKEIQSGSTGSDGKTTLTTYYSATGSGDCQGRLDWAGLVCRTRRCAEPSGYCSLIWAAKLTGHWRSAYRVDLSYTIMVEGHTVHAWSYYGHSEHGDYLWHGSWGAHPGSDRGRYRYDVFFIGHVEGYSKVEIDFAGDVIMPGGKPYTLTGYGKWE